MFLKNLNEGVPAGYKQTFQNKFTSSISKNEVIKMKIEGKLTDRDLEITKFLFKFTFATVEQIYTYLKSINYLTQKKVIDGEEVTETSINSIKSRLDKLVQNRILNKFMLSVVEEDRINQDALCIYCLDLGGKFLLTNYTNEDTTDWYVTKNLKASELISKELFTTQFYLRLLETCGDKVVYFETKPIRKCDKINMELTFEFGIKSNGEVKYFIGEVARDFDIPIHFRKKVEKLERLMETNAWRKYYFDTDTPPVLLLFGEDDLMANDLGRLTSSTTIERFRLSTDERILGDLSGAFMAYSPEVNKLRLVKSKIFS